MHRPFCAVAMAVVCVSSAFGQGGVLDQAPPRFAMSGDLKIHYKALGQDDTAVLFIHGWCGDHTVWHHQAEALNGTVPMLFIDLPGYGKSDKPRIEYTMDLFAKGVEAVMRDAGVEQAVLVGHSMGTPVARQFYRLYPEKTAGLIFVDGSLRPFISDPAQAEAFLAMFKEETFRQTSQQFLGAMLPPDMPAATREHIMRLAAGADPHVAISSARAMFDDSIWMDDLIDVPVQALMAESPHWTEEYKQYVKKIVPDLDYREFTGVSHFLFMEEPEKINRAMVEFLTRQGLIEEPAPTETPTPAG